MQGLYYASCNFMQALIKPQPDGIEVIAARMGGDSPDRFDKGVLQNEVGSLAVLRLLRVSCDGDDRDQILIFWLYPQNAKFKDLTPNSPNSMTYVFRTGNLEKCQKQYL